MWGSRAGALCLLRCIGLCSQIAGSHPGHQEQQDARDGEQQGQQQVRAAQQRAGTWRQPAAHVARQGLQEMGGAGRRPTRPFTGR